MQKILRKSFSAELSSTLFYVEHAGIFMASVSSTLLVSLSHSFLIHWLQISRTKFVTGKKKKELLFTVVGPSIQLVSRFEAVGTF